MENVPELFLSPLNAFAGCVAIFAATARFIVIGFDSTVPAALETSTMYCLLKSVILGVV